jgi:hypothetical protein
VMHTLLAGGGESATLVEPRAQAALDVFDDHLVFTLDTVERRPAPRSSREASQT